MLAPCTRMRSRGVRKLPRKCWMLPWTGLHYPAYASSSRRVIAPIHLACVRPHLASVSNSGPTVQDSLKKTGVSPVETTEMVQRP